MGDYDRVIWGPIVSFNEVFHFFFVLSVDLHRLPSPDEKVLLFGGELLIFT